MQTNYALIISHVVSPSQYNWRKIFNVFGFREVFSHKKIMEGKTHKHCSTSQVLTRTAWNSWCTARSEGPCYFLKAMNNVAPTINNCICRRDKWGSNLASKASKKCIAELYRIPGPFQNFCPWDMTPRMKVGWGHYGGLVRPTVNIHTYIHNNLSYLCFLW
jgi:hypothetical protein